MTGTLRCKFSISAAISVLFFFYSLLILLPGSSLLMDGDTFWHILTGQWILDHGQFPTVDFYSYTAVGRRWISGEWLSEIFLALAFKFGGWRGVVILSAIACATVVSILCSYLLQNVRFSLAVGWAAITAFAMGPHYLARPHLFSYILMLLWLIVLLNAYDRKDFRPPIITLAILMILWCNLHGSFTLGLIMLYVFGGIACYEKIVQQNYIGFRQILIAMLVVSASALINPYGIYPALLTLEVAKLNYIMQHIPEWQSPNFQIYKLHLYLLVGLFATMIGFGIRLRGPRLVLFCMFMFLGLSHARGLVMFFLITPIILAQPVAKLSEFWGTAITDRSSNAAGLADPILSYLQKHLVLIPAMCLAGAAFATTLSWARIDVGPPEEIAPKSAVDFVKQNGITGNVFNSFSFAGYLMFRGIPTFIDSRSPPYSDNFMQNYNGAVNLVDINKAFQLLDEYKVNWVILHPTIEPLAVALARNKFWDEVYSDKYSVVFVRRP